MWLNPSNPQLDKKGQLHHLLTLEGLPAEILWQILDTAKTFVGTKVKKVPLLRAAGVRGARLKAGVDSLAAQRILETYFAGGELC